MRGEVGRERGEVKGGCLAKAAKKIK